MNTRVRACCACVALVAGFAYGTDYNIFGDISGAESVDFQGDPDNELYYIYTLGPGPAITELSWDVNLTTLGISWAEEASFTITDSIGNSVTISPGAGDAFGVKSMNYTGSAAVTLLPMGGPMLLEFHEIGFDDNPDAADAFFESGSVLYFSSIGIQHFVKIEAVPAPSGAGLLGLGVLLGSRRRRS